MEVVEKTTVKWDIQIQPWSFVTLTLFSNDVQELAVHLQKKLAQAPNFFKKTPLILAFDEEQEEIEISTLQTVLSILERYQLHLSGCSGPVHWVSSIADFFNIPYLMNEKNSEIKHKKDSQVLTEPLRAGQQFYTQDDVIILARTHSGSEVISQGHIHCYSKAQGRLIAGVNGQKESKIFCQSLDAELLSIAGVFMTKRQIDENYLGKQCIIELKDGQLNIQLIEKELT